MLRHKYPYIGLQTQCIMGDVQKVYGLYSCMTSTVPHINKAIETKYLAQGHIHLGDNGAWTYGLIVLHWSTGPHTLSQTLHVDWIYHRGWGNFMWKCPVGSIRIREINELVHRTSRYIFLLVRKFISLSGVIMKSENNLLMQPLL